MSPLSNGVWQLFVAPLAGVEQQGRGSLGNGVLAVGILHPLLLDFRFIRGTHPLSFVSLGGGGSLVVREWSNMSRQTKILRSHFVNDSVLLKNIGPGFSIFDSRSVTEFLAVIFAVSTA